MQIKNLDDNIKICDDDSCIFKKRIHEHVITNNGGYIRYVNDSPKEKENANSSR